MTEQKRCLKRTEPLRNALTFDFAEVVMSNIQEECGVFAIISPDRCDVASSAYYGLFALQHRGQQSCGITVNDDGLFSTYKDLGIVNDVFTRSKLENLGQGNMAIGHVLYASGNITRDHAQPIVVDHTKGRLAIASNVCLINAAELREEFELKGSIFRTNSDAELILHIIVEERLRSASIEEAVCKAVKRLEGAYSFVVMSPKKIIAVRDPRGFKPLCYGARDDGSIMVASESCALNAAGAKLIRDVEPGEIVVFDKKGRRSFTEGCNQKERSLCVFEYVYFARPDSIIDGASVHAARLNAGRFLAREHPVEADVVIGVPDSGLDAALGYSRESGIPYGIGFLKNKYIARTFIAPGQKSREDKVRIKLNPIEATLKGKRVIMIDDSIVRGTTSARIVKLVREAGATEVHMRISSPPFLNPCYYGTDATNSDTLIASHHTVEEIAKIIGVDSLGYLSIDGIKKIACENGCGYCTACFDGNYPTRKPSTTDRSSKYDRKISENNN